MHNQGALGLRARTCIGIPIRLPGKKIPYKGWVELENFPTRPAHTGRARMGKPAALPHNRGQLERERERVCVRRSGALAKQVPKEPGQPGVLAYRFAAAEENFHRFFAVKWPNDRLVLPFLPPLMSNIFRCDCNCCNTNTHTHSEWKTSPKWP